MKNINWRMVFAWFAYLGTTIGMIAAFLLEGPAIAWLTASLVGVILLRVEAMISLYNANFYAVQDDDEEDE